MQEFRPEANGQQGPQSGAKRASLLTLFELEPNFTAMKRWLAFSLGAAVCVAVVLAIAIFASRCPLGVMFANIKPSGVLDDTGKEVWLVTLTISNHTGAPIHFANEWLKVEAKNTNRWSEVENRADLTMLAGYSGRELLIVTPSGSIACRLHLKYAPQSLAWRLSQHLGRFGALLPPRFWRSIYLPSGRNPHWTEKAFEVELP